MLLVNWEPRANVVLEEREHMFRMTQSNVEAAAVQSKALSYTTRREASDDQLIRAQTHGKVQNCGVSHDGS